MPTPLYVPGTRTSLLSAPSKMQVLRPDHAAPGQDRADHTRPHTRPLVQVWSWSIPALDACPWKETAPAPDGSPAICAGCYATKGRYALPSTNVPQNVRYQWTRDSLRTPAGTAAWVATMTAGIVKRTAALPESARLFRIHDSGDFYSPAYLHAWAAIIRATPDVHYWAPTRSWRAILETRGPTLERWRAGFADLLSLPNLSCRPSMLWVGGVVIDVAALTGLPFAAGTTVQVGHTALPNVPTCTAPDHGGVCGPCTACWTAPSIPRAYVLH